MDKGGEEVSSSSQFPRSLVFLTTYPLSKRGLKCRAKFPGVLHAKFIANLHRCKIDYMNVTTKQSFFCFSLDFLLFIFANGNNFTFKAFVVYLTEVFGTNPVMIIADDGCSLSKGVGRDKLCNNKKLFIYKNKK